MNRLKKFEKIMDVEIKNMIKQLINTSSDILTVEFDINDHMTKKINKEMNYPSDMFYRLKVDFYSGVHVSINCIYQGAVVPTIKGKHIVEEIDQYLTEKGVFYNE